MSAISTKALVAGMGALAKLPGLLGQDCAAQYSDIASIGSVNDDSKSGLKLRFSQMYIQMLLLGAVAN